jgi:hypothetical protein
MNEGGSSQLSPFAVNDPLPVSPPRPLSAPASTELRKRQREDDPGGFTGEKVYSYNMGELERSASTITSSTSYGDREKIERLERAILVLHQQNMTLRSILQGSKDSVSKIKLADQIQYQKLLAVVKTKGLFCQRCQTDQIAEVTYSCGCKTCKKCAPVSQTGPNGQYVCPLCTRHCHMGRF